MASTGTPQEDLDADFLDTQQRVALLTVQDDSALLETPTTLESYYVQTNDYLSMDGAEDPTIQSTNNNPQATEARGQLAELNKTLTQVSESIQNDALLPAARSIITILYYNSHGELDSLSLLLLLLMDLQS